MPGEAEASFSPTVQVGQSANGQQIEDVSEAAIDIIRHVESAKLAAKEAANSKASIAAVLADAQTKLADIGTAKTEALAAKTKIEADQAVIATKSAHIQDAQEHAAKVRANLDRELTAATKQATDAEGQRNRAQSAADSSVEILTIVRTTKAAADADAEAITAVRKTAEESSAITKGLADKSATIQARITDYETKLDDLKAQCAIQLKTIESLLPGAASAGLAHAFDERRQTFLEPRRKWETWYVGSIGLLAVLAVVSWWQAYHGSTSPTWDESLLLWLSRLPVAAPLIWLAIHASHEAALAKRLEEDYGYKSAVASSFMGFHQQMTEIGSAAAANVPLAKLCEDTLSTIASPPGRIYDKHKLTASPADELSGAAKAVGDVFNGTGLKRTT